MILKHACNYHGLTHTDHCSLQKDKIEAMEKRMENHLLQPLVPSLRSGSALGLPHIVVVQHQMLSLPLRQELLPDGGKVPPKQQHSLLKLLSLGITPALTHSCPDKMKAQGLLGRARQGLLQSCPALCYPGHSACHTVRCHQSAKSAITWSCHWGLVMHIGYNDKADIMCQHLPSTLACTDATITFSI